MSLMNFIFVFKNNKRVVTIHMNSHIDMDRFSLKRTIRITRAKLKLDFWSERVSENEIESD